MHDSHNARRTGNVSFPNHGCLHSFGQRGKLNLVRLRDDIQAAPAAPLSLEYIFFSYFHIPLFKKNPSPK